MTTLRQEAFRMMEAMPEDGLVELIRYMTTYNSQYAEKAQRIARKKAALDNILGLAKHLPHLDAEKELMDSRKERLLNADIS